MNYASREKWVIRRIRFDVRQVVAREYHTNNLLPIMMMMIIIMIMMIMMMMYAIENRQERGELLCNLLNTLASRFPSIKFVKMHDDQKSVCSLFTWNSEISNNLVIHRSITRSAEPMLVKYENGEPASSYRPDMNKIRDADGLSLRLFS